MLKTLFCAGTALAATLACAPAAARDTPAPQTAPAAAATVDADPALWVVKDDDTTIYLFGTVHALKPGLGWFDEAVKDAFDKSGQLMLEMVEPDQATVQQLVIKMALNQSGPKVSEQLPEGKRAAYAAALTELGAPPAAFDQFDPWLSIITLTAGSLPKFGYSPDQGAEKVLTSAAKAAGKPVAGLETIEQQLGYFDGLPQPVQIKFLATTIDELPQMGATLDKMVARWSAGDPAGLATIMNDGMQEVPEVATVLLTERNARWAEWIEKRLAEPGTVFIAVGAGHLAGKDSVQDFLATRKVKVTRINY